MKRKIFRYKAVYWFTVLLSFILMIAFGFGCHNRWITNSFSSGEEILFSITTFSIAVLATLSFFSLILKNKKSVGLLSGLLLLILITASLGILRTVFISKNFGINRMDYFLAFGFYLVLFGLLYIVRRFKAVHYENIDLIGLENE